MANRNDKQAHIDYLTRRRDFLSVQMQKLSRELDRCNLLIKYLDAIIDENSHLDAPKPMNKEQGELVYLGKHKSFLEKKLRVLQKDDRGCARKLRDLNGQLEEEAAAMSTDE